MIANIFHLWRLCLGYSLELRLWYKQYLYAVPDDKNIHEIREINSTGVDLKNTRSNILAENSNNESDL